MSRTKQLLEALQEGKDVPFRKYAVCDENEDVIKRFTQGEEGELINYIHDHEDVIYLYVYQRSSQTMSQRPVYDKFLFWERDVDPVDKLEELRVKKED